MEPTKTIAIIGVQQESEMSFIKALASRYRILLLPAAMDENAAGQATPPLVPAENVEWLSCEKNACWEADVIFLRSARDMPEEILGQIAKVSVQKILVLINTEPHWGEKLFPHAKVVFVHFEPGNSFYQLQGQDSLALQEIKNMLHATDVPLDLTH